MCNIGLYLDVYEQMLKEKRQFEMEDSSQDSNYFLEIVEKKFPKSEKPWLFLTYAASVLVNEKDFFPIEAEVSKLSYNRIHHLVPRIL